LALVRRQSHPKGRPPLGALCQAGTAHLRRRERNVHHADQRVGVVPVHGRGRPLGHFVAGISKEENILKSQGKIKTGNPKESVILPDGDPTQACRRFHFSKAVNSKTVKTVN
jgi:hypothetical protein